MQALEINVSWVLHNSIKKETEEVKQKKLASWIKENVYKEVLNEGHKTISTHWVVSLKVIDGVMSTKTRPVARGFEEKEEQTIKSDSPTCLQESVCLFFSVAVSNGLNVGSVDIKYAFLQGYNIDIEIYIYIKPSQEANSDKLSKLQKVIWSF